MHLDSYLLVSGDQHINLMLMISDGGTEGLRVFPSISQAFPRLQLESEVTYRHVIDAWSPGDVTSFGGRR